MPESKTVDEIARWDKRFRGDNSNDRENLDRGVWTSPGAGDIRRAITAGERLVLLLEASSTLERRDLATLYALQGLPEYSKAEPSVYRRSDEGAAAGGQDRELVERLWDVVKGAEGLEPLSLGNCYGCLETWEAAKPLTW
jgi:hypothetical protein